jgi:hypothetical protein
MCPHVLNLRCALRFCTLRRSFGSVIELQLSLGDSEASFDDVALDSSRAISMHCRSECRGTTTSLSRRYIDDAYAVERAPTTIDFELDFDAS